MRTVLVYHAGSALEERVILPWLASFSDVVGTIAIREPASRRRRRIRRELQRVGPVRFLDVLAFRLYYKLALARKDAEWERRVVQASEKRFPPPAPTRHLETPSPNSPEAVAFLLDVAPDLLLARCRSLLKREVFSSASLGTFVLHPGIAPEYRNSHGCFWALSERELDRVGLTMLRIDEGVDTGPVYGYFTYQLDERRESHVVIQKRMVLENLDPIRDLLLSVAAGEARPLDTQGRASRAWGQPWLTAYARWKRAARAEAP